MLDRLWHYRAKLDRTIDGDTVQVELDAGMHTYRIERLRLLDCWAPEVRGPERYAGLAAKRWVDEWFAVIPVQSWPLIIRTEKSDAFGRYLAMVYRVDTLACLNTEMVAAGHATVSKPLPVSVIAQASK